LLLECEDPEALKPLRLTPEALEAASTRPFSLKDHLLPDGDRIWPSSPKVQVRLSPAATASTETSGASQIVFMCLFMRRGRFRAIGTNTDQGAGVLLTWSTEEFTVRDYAPQPGVCRAEF
jgi:hypothetical protein